MSYVCPCGQDHEVIFRELNHLIRIGLGDVPQPKITPAMILKAETKKEKPPAEAKRRPGPKLGSKKRVPHREMLNRHAAKMRLRVEHRGVRMRGVGR